MQPCSSELMQKWVDDPCYVIISYIVQAYFGQDEATCTDQDLSQSQLMFIRRSYSEISHVLDILLCNITFGANMWLHVKAYVIIQPSMY